MKKQKRDKKAEVLWDEVIRMIVAVLGILVLLYLAVSLYQIFTRQSDLEKARTELGNIIEKIKALEQLPDGGSVNYLLLTPNGWGLSGWPYKEYNVQYCIQQGWNRCICICPSATLPSTIASGCDKQKVCQKVPDDSPIKTFKVNPNGNSNLTPIDIVSMKPGVFSTFRGNLLITYNKTLQQLSIIPQVAE